MPATPLAFAENHFKGHTVSPSEVQPMEEWPASSGPGTPCSESPFPGESEHISSFQERVASRGPNPYVRVANDECEYSTLCRDRE